MDRKFEGVRSSKFDPMVLGVNLKIARRRKKLGQLEVANALGISRTSLIHYESGKVEIPLFTLIRLMELYDVTFRELTGGAVG